MSFPSSNKAFSAGKSAGLALVFFAVLGLLEANNLLRLSLSAFKVNLMLGFLKLATAMLPVNLVSSICKLKLLLANSFLISAWANKSKLPSMPPLGRLGSFISRVPTSLGKSKIKLSRLPLKGEENLLDSVRLPCKAEISPVMPAL